MKMGADNSARRVNLSIRCQHYDTTALSHPPRTQWLGNMMHDCRDSHRVQADSKAHPPSLRKGYRDSLHGGKAAEA